MFATVANRTYKSWSTLITRQYRKDKHMDSRDKPLKGGQCDNSSLDPATAEILRPEKMS